MLHVVFIVGHRSVKCWEPSPDGYHPAPQLSLDGEMNGKFCTGPNSLVLAMLLEPFVEDEWSSRQPQLSGQVTHLKWKGLLLDFMAYYDSLVSL